MGSKNFIYVDENWWLYNHEYTVQFCMISWDIVLDGPVFEEINVCSKCTMKNDVDCLKSGRKFVHYNIITFSLDITTPDYRDIITDLYNIWHFCSLRRNPKGINDWKLEVYPTRGYSLRY